MTQVLLTMPYLIQTSFELRNACAGNGIQRAAVSPLQKVIGYSGNHGSIVSAKL